LSYSHQVRANFITKPSAFQARRGVFQFGRRKRGPAINLLLALSADAGVGASARVQAWLEEGLPKKGRWACSQSPKSSRRREWALGLGAEVVLGCVLKGPRCRPLPRLKRPLDTHFDQRAQALRRPMTSFAFHPWAINARIWPSILA